MEANMEGSSADKPLDYGVQIRFIDEQKDPNKSRQKNKATKPSSYGVMVRVQGISGQPFVVLNNSDGQAGVPGAPGRGNHPTLEIPDNPHHERRDSLSSDVPENPYALPPGPRQVHSDSQYSSSDEEPGSQHVVRMYDSNERLRKVRSSHEGHGSLPRRKPPQATERLRKARSQGSLLSDDEAQSPSGSEREGRGRGPAQPHSRRVPTAAKASSTADVSGAPLDPNAIDTKPLSSVDSLISKFDTRGGPLRGRPARRSRISSEEKRRSQSLDNRSRERPVYQETLSNQRPLKEVTGRKYYGSSDALDVPPASSMLPVKQSVTEHLRPHTAPSSKPLHKVSEAPSLMAASPPTQQQHNITATAKQPLLERSPKQEIQLKSTPDLLKDQQECSPASEQLTKRLIFNILKDGTIESESSLRRKASLVYDKVQGAKMVSASPEMSALSSQKNELERKVTDLQQKLDEQILSRKQLGTKLNNAEIQDLHIQLEENIEEREQLKALYQKTRKELQVTEQELMDMKLEKDTVEAEMKDLQDEMKVIHRELKNARKSANDSEDREGLLTELARTKEELDLIANAKQSVENILRQRERELTALKGVLKEEVSNHDKAMEDLREQCQQDMDHLRKNIEQVTQTQQSVESERQKVNATVRSLQRQLEESNEETGHWKEMFQKTRDELRGIKQELLQMKLEKEECEEELRDMKDGFSSIQDEMNHVKKTSVKSDDLVALQKELAFTKKELQHLEALKDSQESVLQKKALDVNALQGTLSDEAARHAKELEKVRLQNQREVELLRRNFEEASKVRSSLEEDVGAAEQARQVAESALKQLKQANEDLKRKFSQMDFQMGEYKDHIVEQEAIEGQLRDKLAKIEVERKQMEQTLGDQADQEQELAVAKRALENRLEETQRVLHRQTQDHQELSDRLQEEMRQKEQLRRAKGELEDQKRALDRSLEKLQREVEESSERSGNSVVILQSQLEEHREKSRRELSELQRRGKERAMELETSHQSIKRLQEEIGRLKHELQQSQAERDSAVLDKELLEQRLQKVEKDVDSKRRTQEDRSRQVKVLEDKIKHLEIELDEEKNNADLLTERVNRTRDQIEQMRAELMQERASRQDLECDKISLERQAKELKARLANSEGSLKSTANLPQLESRIRELEDRLQTEERDRSVLQASNRKLERKVKELSIQIEDERQQVSDEKDQLTLRVKALKRQVDESEEEIERLETAKKKALREVEELQEASDQQENRIKTLEKDLWRKNARSQLSRHSDDLSSDEDFSPGCDPSITSLITESNLQTSSC